MTDEALFDIEQPEPPTGATKGERLRARNAYLILSGLHPLSYLVPPAGLRLHPLTARVTEDDRHGRDPYRCGSCVFREVLGGHGRSYPKCLFGRTETPVPERLRRKYGPQIEIRTPRATGAETSDVRAWWPGCVNYQPKPVTVAPVTS